MMICAAFSPAPPAAPPRPGVPACLKGLLWLAIPLALLLSASARSAEPAHSVPGDAAQQDAPMGIDLRIERLLGDLEHPNKRATKGQNPAVTAARRAALDRLGTVPTPAALALGRAAAKADPGNFALRLRLIDLLRRAGLAAEADASAAALIAETPATAGPDAERLAQARPRALLLRARIAYDQRDYPGAHTHLAALSTLAPPPELEQAAAELAAKITTKERELAQRAEFNRLRALPATEALPLVRAGAQADSANLDLRLLLMDVLADTGDIAEADTLARDFETDPLTAVEPGKRREALLKRARFALRQDHFAVARALAERAAAAPTDSPEEAARNAARIALLHERIAAREHALALRQEIERIGREPTPEALTAAAALRQREPASVDAAFHHAGLLRKSQAFTPAETIYREVLAGPGASDPQVAARAQRYLRDLQLRAEIFAIGQEPTATALAQAKALREREPDSIDAAFHHALLLRKERAFGEAEAIYRAVQAGPGATDPDIADRARLQLAELYLRANRVGDAATLVQNLDPLTSSQYVAERSGIINERIAARLQPDRLSGVVGVTAGHDSNAATRADLLDEDTGDFSVNKVGSPFQTLDVATQYRHVIDANGNVLAASANASHTFYTDDAVGDIDRSRFELRAGPIYALPSLDAAISGGLSYRYRLRDYDFARRSPGVFLNFDRYLGSRWRLRADSLVEYGTDLDPDRDGMGYQAGVQGRFDWTAHDTLSLSLRARHDDARVAFETRTAYGLGAAYRHQFAGSALPGTWFWDTALNFNRVDYDGANPRPDYLGKTRGDRHWQVDAGVGFDLGEQTQIALRASYLTRTSNIDRYDTDSLRVQLHVTRTY